MDYFTNLMILLVKCERFSDLMDLILFWSYSHTWIH